MQHNMYWKKGIFSDTYRIFSNNQQIGELKNKAFSQSSVAVLVAVFIPILSSSN